MDGIFKSYYFFFIETNIKSLSFKDVELRDSSLSKNYPDIKCYSIPTSPADQAPLQNNLVNFNKPTSPLDKVQLKALLPLVSTGSTIGIPVTGFIAC